MMNEIAHVMHPPRRARPPIARTAAAVIATAALAVLVAACGGNPSSGTSPSAAGAGGASSAYVSHALAFARCMRAHGVPRYPDPDSNGAFPKAGLQQLGLSPSRMRAVQAPCMHLLQAGPAPITAHEQQDYLNAAACMRSHGLANFPDPVFSGGGVSFRIPSSIDTKSQRFIRARQTCARLIPAGLPYSGSGG